MDSSSFDLASSLALPLAISAAIFASLAEISASFAVISASLATISAAIFSSFAAISATISASLVVTMLIFSFYINNDITVYSILVHKYFKLPVEL